MKKKKIMVGMLFIAIVFIMLLILFPSTVDAAVGYTRKIPSNDGSITINLTGLSLDENKQYEFGIATKGGKPEKWHVITNYTKNTAEVNLSSSTEDIRDVLKVTDTGHLYIREKDKDDNTYIVKALEINLKLPYLQAVSYSIYYDAWYSISYLYEKIGGGTLSKNTYYQFKKVTDKSLIEKYLKVKEGASDITSLEEFISKYPTTGYVQSGHFNFSEYNDGLYIVWVKMTGEGCKDVYGVIMHDGLPDARTIDEYLEGPKVSSIKILSPESGTYNTPQTVEIAVFFDKKIQGEKVPTLKIKFGDSEERNVTNGTIENTRYSSPCITYKYNIQNGDNGQLQTVDLSGGNITDELGNEARLSCPALTGDIAIKANTQGTTTNNTENQDKTNDNTTNNTENQNKTSNNATNNTENQNKASNNATNNIENQNKASNNTTNNTENQNKASNNTVNNSNSSNKDKTTINGNLPQTGVSYAIVVAAIVALIVGVVLYTRYRKMKDII